MKDTSIAEKLFKEGSINEQSHQKISSFYANRLFSVGLEVRTILYLGILMLSTGLGILVYKNIDTIGHLAVLAFIALVSLGCFAYCYTKRQPYSNQKLASANMLTDYVLLLGCLSFATFMGYMQYQYSTFGPHNEIAFLIPAIIFFTVAYYFDHIGILSMAITALAGFAGIAITPTSVFHNDFASRQIILTGLGLGGLLVAAGLYLDKRKIKSHFTFTYLNFAIHVLFISCIAGFAEFDFWILFILLMGVFVFFLVRYANKEKSFYFLFFAVIYGYIGASCLVMRSLIGINNSDSLILLIPFYFISSSVYVVYLLRQANRKYKQHDIV
jgi:hypothetical protein